MNASSGLAALSLVLTGQASPPNNDIAPRHVAILCDPAHSALSVRTDAEAEIPDPQYSVRWLVKVDDLIVHFSADGGRGHYQAGIGRFERCGRFVILVEGDFLNANRDGEMGAIDPFAAISIIVANPRIVNNPRLYPAGMRRSTIRLAPCDRQNRRWKDCPDGWAVRVDLAYQPKTEKLLVHEWVVSGDVIGGALRRSERASTVRAPLRLWRDTGHRLSRH